MFKKVLLFLASVSAVSCSDGGNDIDNMCNNVISLSEKNKAVFSFSIGYKTVEYTSFDVCVSDQMAVETESDKVGCSNEFSALSQCLGTKNVEDVNELLNLCARDNDLWAECIKNGRT